MFFITTSFFKLCGDSILFRITDRKYKFKVVETIKKMPNKKDKKATGAIKDERSPVDNNLLFGETDEPVLNDNADQNEEKRESLLVLATLGMTKEYLGQEIGVEKIYKLPKKSVEKLYGRYQQVQGKNVSEVLITKGIQLGVKLISYLLPIENAEQLIQDLENDQLVTRELSNGIGLLVLKGGRFVALASGFIQVANNISIGGQQIPKKSLIVDYVEEQPVVN